MLFSSVLGVFLALCVSFVQGGFLPLAGPGPISKKPIVGDSPLFVCDLEESHLLEIQNVILSPNPPKRGKVLSIVGVGEVFKEIEEGAYVDVEVRLGYIKLLTQRFDLCQVLSDNDVEGLQCPVAAGQYTLRKDVEIPNEVPPGKYTVLARAYTVKDELMTCITGEVVFPQV